MTSTPVAGNLLGCVETPEFGADPYRFDRDGRPYLPTGGAGVVLGLRLGDGVFDVDADHAAPGVTLVHPDPAARYALTAFACLGNEVTVRTGAAAGAVGRVLGKRGEAGRVIALFPRAVLARMAPADTVSVRAYGQGAPGPADGVRILNVDPALLARLPVRSGSPTTVTVRGRVPSRVAGNGVGRPAQLWDVDLQLDRTSATRWAGLAGLRLGDLVCVDDLDVRHNVGYRAGWLTVGVVVHAASPLPGHGPGLMPVLCGTAAAFDVRVDPDGHVGVTPEAIGLDDA